jgi:hypothetical protein
MDQVQKNFMIALIAFLFISCMVVTAILGLSIYFQPAAGNNTMAGGTSNLTGLVLPNETNNKSYTQSVLENIPSNGSNMTQEEIVAARDKIKEENAIPLFLVKTKYGLNDNEINGVIDTYLRSGREEAYNYIVNLSEKHPDLKEIMHDYNESGGDIGVIFGQ